MRCDDSVSVRKVHREIEPEYVLRLEKGGSLKVKALTEVAGAKDDTWSRAVDPLGRCDTSAVVSTQAGVLLRERAPGAARPRGRHGSEAGLTAGPGSSENETTSHLPGTMPLAWSGPDTAATCRPGGRGEVGPLSACIAEQKQAGIVSRTG